MSSKDKERFTQVLINWFQVHAAAVLLPHGLQRFRGASPGKSAADRAVSSANVITASVGSAGKQVPWKPPLKIELWLSPKEKGAFPPTQALSLTSPQPLSLLVKNPAVTWFRWSPGCGASPWVLPGSPACSRA